jgi:hypothetical protein
MRARAINTNNKIGTKRRLEEEEEEEEGEALQHIRKAIRYILPLCYDLIYTVNLYRLLLITLSTFTE